MRIKIASGRVYQTGSPEELLRRLHQTSADKDRSYLAYLDLFVERLRPQKVWITPPDGVRGSEDAFARWLAAEMMRTKRWAETTDPTDEEKAEKAARAAAEARAKAAAAAAAKAAAPASAPKPAAVPASAPATDPAS